MQSKISLIEALEKRDIHTANRLLSEGLLMPTDRQSYFFMMISFVCDKNKEAISWLLQNCPLAQEYSSNVLTTAFCDSNWEMVSVIREYCPLSVLSEHLLIDAHQRGEFEANKGLVYVKKHDKLLADSFVPIYFKMIGQHPMAHISELPKWMQNTAIRGVTSSLSN